VGGLTVRVGDEDVRSVFEIVYFRILNIVS